MAADLRYCILLLDGKAAADEAQAVGLHLHTHRRPPLNDNQVMDAAKDPA